jgi:hypothetical protein
VAVSGTTKINREDYGLTGDAALETGGILLGEEITTTVELEVSEQGQIGHKRSYPLRRSSLTEGSETDY